MEVLELYAVVVEAVEGDKEVPSEAVTWLAEAIFLNAMTGTPVEEALGLKMPGSTSRTIRYQYLQRLRDEAILEAWKGTAGATPWEKSQNLSRHIERFEFGQVIRGFREAANDIESALDRAFDTEIRMPTTPEGVNAIVQRKLDNN